MYGGGLYIDSSTSTMTLQGKAIKKAAIDFGDGRTLPFAPCKRGYVPLVVVPVVRSKNSSSSSNSIDNSSNGGDNGNGNNGAKDDEKQKEYKRMVACSFHEKYRRKRLARDKGKLRGGEANPNELFWSKKAENATSTTETETEKGAADVVVKNIEGARTTTQVQHTK